MRYIDPPFFSWQWLVPAFKEVWLSRNSALLCLELLALLTSVLNICDFLHPGDLLPFDLFVSDP